MSMNIHEAGIYESVRETDKQKQTGERATNTTLQTQSKTNTMQILGVITSQVKKYISFILLLIW